MDGVREGEEFFTFCTSDDKKEEEEENEEFDEELEKIVFFDFSVLAFCAPHSLAGLLLYLQ